jgi:sulfite reductase beta subunit-like hemoprotein
VRPRIESCPFLRSIGIPVISYMCRLRIPNGIVKAQQFAGLADLAERYGGGYAHVTTRANIQIREVEAANAVAMIEAIQDLGLCSRGSGADNIRNVTGTPTAGVDPQELIDTRPYTREWHFHILNDRSLYGLPRKFNVAFDGAGRIPVLEDTNDIGFQAVEVNDGFGLEAGVWFKLCSAASPGTAISLATPACWYGRTTPARPRMRWCACSSNTATAPTAPRRG